MSIITHRTQADAFECDSCGETFQPDQIGRDITTNDSEVIIYCEECADGDDSTFSMDDLAKALEARGFPAFVAMTGGGVATLYGGPIVGTDEWDGKRYVVAVGPGSYGQDGQPSEGYWGELFIGPDTDNGEGGFWRGRYDLDMVADYVAAHADEYRQAVQSFLTQEALNA